MFVGTGVLIIVSNGQWVRLYWALQDLYIKLLTTYLRIRGIVLTKDGRWDSTWGGHSSLRGKNFT